MRIDKFTAKLQEALADAQSIAVGRDHNQIAPAHLVQALLRQQGGSIRPILNQMGVDTRALETELDALIERLPQIKENLGDVQLSPELAKLLNLADKFAQQNGDKFITSEMVLLAALEDRSGVGELFGRLQVQKDALKRVIEQNSNQWALMRPKLLWLRDISIGESVRTRDQQPARLGLARQSAEHRPK